MNTKNKERFPAFLVFLETTLFHGLIRFEDWFVPVFELVNALDEFDLVNLVTMPRKGIVIITASLSERFEYFRMICCPGGQTAPPFYFFHSRHILTAIAKQLIELFGMIAEEVFLTSFRQTHVNIP